MPGRNVAAIDSRGKKRVQTVNKDPSKTIQSDAHLADITNILKRFGAEGMEMLDETALTFADISEFTDLADALNQAKVAEIEFLKLPSKVREIFEHDVAVWLDTAHDKDKRDALVQAGFIKENVEEDKVVVEAGQASPPGSPTPAKTIEEGSKGPSEVKET